MIPKDHVVDNDVVELLRKNGYNLLRAIYAYGFLGNVVVFSRGETMKCMICKKKLHRNDDYYESLTSFSYICLDCWNRGNRG